jgi:hypothetical protein
VIAATLSAQEVAQVTGYKRPADQLEELHRQGFYRARRSPTTGAIILEREHYTAVCAGSRTENTPKLRTPQLRMA